MIIVELTGGLGNQMFEYVLYLALKEKRSDVFLSDYIMRRTGDKAPEHSRKNLLNDVFVVSEAEYASDKDMMKLGDYSRTIFARVRRRIFRIHTGRRLNLFLAFHLREDIRKQNSPFAVIRRKLSVPKQLADKNWVDDQMSKLVAVKNVAVQGFWQEFDYAKSVEGKVRSELAFKNPMDDKNQMVAEQMKQETSVSINVRRGDYLKVAKDRMPPVSYYIQAMEYFTQKFKDVHFYVSSDDIPWCRENLKDDRITFLDWNNGVDNRYKDMQLMSLCKHNIIDNSTFAIWAAWLNANPDKIVIRPKKYFYNDEYFLYPDEWLVM